MIFDRVPGDENKNYKLEAVIDMMIIKTKEIFESS